MIRLDAKTGREYVVPDTDPIATKMRHTFEHWDIYYYLYWHNQQGRYPSVMDLERVFLTDRTQVYRVIKAIKEQLGVHLFHSDERGGYAFAIQKGPTSPRMVFEKFYEAMMIEKRRGEHECT